MSTNVPTTQELLSVSPLEAVVMMFNAAYNTAMPLRWGRATAPVDNGNGTCTVTLSVRPPISPSETINYTGTKTFTYPRMDLTELLGGGLVDDFIPKLPTTTQTLADLVAARFGIVNDENDFLIEQIKDNASPPFVLKANPLSWRWTGQLIFNATGRPPA
ncbi:MAG TPA: hypothetical protein VN081_02595 [Dongiaceae bacterium]|nr:hypothetical protein [Dongiaceae bacterium]